MFSSKQLSQDQVATIRTWAAAGAQLPEIQLKLREEFGFAVTYMDTRFIVLDLGIELIEEKKEEPAPVVESPLVATGAVSVTMDTIPRPGSLISGKAVFSDGESGEWMIDEAGRPALVPATEGYQPSQEDIMEFQKQLRAHVQSTGL